MKKLFAILLSCVSLIATAQTTNLCEPYGGTSGPAAINEIEQVAGAPAVSCLPSWIPGANGTGVGSTFFGAKGVTTYVYCPNADGTWKRTFYAAAYEALPARSLDIAGFWLATDKLAYLTAQREKWGLVSIADPDLMPVWCPHYAAMVAARPANIIWWVPKAASTANPTGTRPTFRWNGTSMISQSTRVTEFTTCELGRATRLVGTTTYGAFAGGPSDLFAVCVRKP
jgi:hypothetical protein